MRKDDGGPAFPVDGWVEKHPTHRAQGEHDPEPGMSLRDWFAGQAIEGIISRGLCQTSDFLTHDAAVIAYRLADAMLAERKKTQETKP